MLVDRLIALCEKFRGRLEDYLLDDVLNAVDHNEVHLAFEKLCDFLLGYKIVISTEEHDDLMRLVEDMEFDPESLRYKYLNELILHDGENGDGYLVSYNSGRIVTPKDLLGEKIIYEIDGILIVHDMKWRVKNRRIIALCERFRGRLRDDLLDDVINTVGHGERWLALDTLCDFLVNDDVRLSMEEYDEMVNLGIDMEFNSDDLSFKYLRPLVLPEDERDDGRLAPGKLRKIFFSKDWSGEKIIHEISDILTAPDTQWYIQTGYGEKHTKSGVPARWVAYEVRDGERIKVVYEPATGRLVTAHPYDRPIPQYKLAS